MMERAGYVGRTKKGKLAPTVAGIVLFASEPAEILPQCRVAIEAKKAGRTVPGDYEGPLLAFRDHLETFFKEQMRHFTEVRELDRVQVGEYPIEAIREAAYNAVSHRDYGAGARVHITLKETEVVIRSPGGLLRPLSLGRVRTFNAPPYSRNPHIAVAVQRMGWIEEKGSGLARMRDSMVAHGLRPPLFDFADGYFMVTLPGYEQGWSTVRVAPGLLAKLDRQQQRIVDLVMTRGRLAAGECAKELKVDVATARRHLRKLVDSGVLESRGSGPRLAYYMAGSE
jgi:ATP-dependent DNA helicase RecG